MLCTLLPWIYGLVSALLGGLIGWYLFRNRKYLPLQQVVEDQNEAYNTLSTTHNTLNARHASIQANLLDLQKTHSEWESRYHTLNNDHLTLSNAKRNLGIEYDNYKADVSTTEAGLQAHLIEIDALTKKREADWDAQQAKLLNDMALRDKNISQLSSQLAGFNATQDALQKKYDTSQVSNTDFISQIGHLNHTVEDLTTDINFEKQRVVALEASEKESHVTIQNLENHVSDLTNQHATLQVAHNDTNALVNALTTAHASEKQSWDAQLVTLTNLHNAALADTSTEDHKNVVNQLQLHLNELGNKNTENLNALTVLQADKEKLASHNLSSISEKEAWEAEKKEHETHVEKLIADIQDYHTKSANLLKSKDDLNTELNKNAEELTQQNEKLQTDSIGFAKLSEELEETKVHLNEVQNQSESADSDWQIAKMRHEEEIEELTDQISENSENFEELRKNIKDLTAQLEEQKNEKQKLEAQLADNIKSVEQLKTENAASKTHYASLVNEKTAWETEKKDSEAHVEKLIADIQDYHTKTAEYLTNTTAQKAENEKQIDLLNTQLTFSKTNFTTQSEHIAELETYKQRYENLLAAQTSTNSLLEQLESERSKLSKDYNALNTLYISLSREDGNWQSRYETLQMRSRNYEQLVADLEAELARLRTTGKILTADVPTKAEVSVKDNLEKIEGIGPKIAELLNNAGINTFLELSEAKVETVREILDNAGSRFRMHDPSTWSEQSKMAHEGKWDELKVYQDHLKGGRES